MRQRTNLAIAALDAAVGDRLCDANSSLAIRMALRSGGRVIPIRPDRLEAVYPDATPRLAVFLHGLGHTENSWRMHADDHDGDGSVTYDSRLVAAGGYTTLYLRYNTGLHISDNGKRLSDLLAAVASGWPTPVEEIIVIAHSMGGLVTRSACHYGQQTEEPWIPAARHVFYLGAPHLVAPLERLTSYATWMLSKTELTRPIAALVNRRSAGIKDLRFGCIVDDWTNCDPDTCLRSHRHNVPLLSTANHYSISATVTTDSATHSAGSLAISLFHPPAPTVATHGTATSRSTLITGTTSDVRITSPCSIIRPCSTPWTPGSRSSPLRSTRMPPFTDNGRQLPPARQIGTTTDAPKGHRQRRTPCPMAHPSRDGPRSSKTLGGYERSDPLDGQVLEVPVLWTCVISPPSRARQRPLTSRR
jgi:pimeloyl-ACP methyl ester carboxylesterase